MAADQRPKVHPPNSDDGCRFRAMGSDAHLIVVGGPPGLANVARRRIEELERRWSRFVPDSEISLLNRYAGIFVGVSPDTILLLELAREAWRLTGGAFDPTVLGAVIRAGYDRSFELLGPNPAAGHSRLEVGAEGIVVDGERAYLPSGTGFDPGGIGKGLAADLICAETMAAGADGVCVNVGGDVRVSGTAPGGGAWTVAVEHPWSHRPLARVGLADGAVATSTTLLRCWSAGPEPDSADRLSRPRHHLIDPRTGLPSDSDLTMSAVVAAECWMAEVLAKAVLLAGADHPFDIVGGTGAQALAVDGNGWVAVSEGAALYLGGSAVPETIDFGPPMDRRVGARSPLAPSPL